MTEQLDEFLAKMRSLPEPLKALVRAAVTDPTCSCCGEKGYDDPADCTFCADQGHGHTRRRFVLAVFPYQKTDRGYIPSVVYENESGHHPMIGNGEFSEPWYFGTDIETAQRRCNEANAERGISSEDADQIVESSIMASIREGAAHEAADEKMRKLGLKLPTLP